MRTTHIRTTVLSVVAVSALALGACSADQQPSDSAASGSTGTSSSPSGSVDSAAGHTEQSSDVVTMTDGWVRANTDGMTGVFGTVHNDTDSDVVLTSATADVEARAEMHETVQSAGSSTMQEAKNGLTVPAHGTLELKPGSFHIMLMDLKTPIAIGQDVHLTVTTADGKTAQFTAAGRAFQGANENYQADDHAGHDDHNDHSGHDGHAGHDGH